MTTLRAESRNRTEQRTRSAQFVADASMLQKGADRAPAFADNRPQAMQLRAVNEAVHHSAAMTAQRQQRDLMQPVDALQRRAANEAAALQALSTQCGNRGIAQRIPVGTGVGTDDDRNNIRVENLIGNEQVTVRGDHHGRAQVMSAFIVGQVNSVGRVLKHYMVVKSGSLYQFPIKHVFQPHRRLQGDFRPNPHDLAARQETEGDRGGQPDAFGGNTDLAHHQQRDNQNLTDLRDATLASEYREENHAHNDAQLNVTRAKKFGSGFGAGTLSVAETDQPLVAGFNAHGLGNTVHRGEAEMAGTVTIDCEALIAGQLVDDDLEVAIGQRLQTARDDFYAAHANTHDSGGARHQESIFASNAGILAHLIGMVKDDLIAERARRHEQALEEQQAQQQLELQALALQQQQEQEAAEHARQQQEELQQRQRQRTRDFLVRAGLVMLAAVLIRLLFF